jgi:DNA-binding response OmpR family regulator
MAERPILIVEDDVDLAENLVEILQDAGYVAEHVTTAEQALERIQRGGVAGVITDFRLPGVGGVDFIHQLRERGIPLPVIVMSAFMDRRVATQAEEVGALDVLAKPVDLKRLFALVAAFVEPDTQVLIVEDNEAFAENVAEALSEEGFSASVGSTAAAALGKRILPRIALVDLRLPDKSGLDVARRLFARDPTISIVFVTAHGEELRKEVESGRAAPFINPREPFLSKPLDIGELVARVRRTLGAAS